MQIVNLIGVTHHVQDMDTSALLHDNRVGGNFIGGRAEGVRAWYREYYSVMWDFIQEGHFVGKDQHMMATACAHLGPSLCFLVAPNYPNKKLDRVSKWFIVVPALHGEIPLVRAWFPAPSSPDVNKEEEPVDLSKILEGINEVCLSDVWGKCVFFMEIVCPVDGVCFLIMMSVCLDDAESVPCRLCLYIFLFGVCWSC